MKRISFFLIIVFISIGCFEVKSFGANKSVRLAGQWPLNYSAKDIAADNDREYLYLCHGDRLNILDKNLNMISTTPITTSGQVDGIFYSAAQKYIYAACRSDGLKIIDVSDVETPKQVGAYVPANNSVELIGVYIDQQRAYLACGISGVLILDISNPVTPLLLQEVELPGAWIVYSYAVDIYAAGNYVWVADLLNGIRIINITDINNPTLTNLLLPNVRDLETSGSYMYAAVESNGMEIIDISAPENAVQSSIFLTSGNAEAVRVDNNYAYVAYAFGSAGIRILDVTDKVNPIADKQWAYTESDVNSIGFFPGDTSLYATSDQAAMKKIDVSDKTNIHSIASFDTPADAMAIAVSGNYLYAVDNNVGSDPSKEGLRIHQIEIPNPESVQFHLTGFCATPGEASDVVVLGRYAYIADGNQGLQIIDIADKANPKIIKNIEINGFSRGVYVSGNYAYVAVGDQGIAIADVSSAANSTLIHTFKTQGYANSVFVAGNYAYVADGDQGLQIINIENKTNPQTIGTLDTSGNAAGLFVEDNYVYLADGSSGLLIINISDNSHPAIISSYDTPGNAQKVSVSGDYAYVADGDKGVCVINISDPVNPIKDTDWSFDRTKGHAGIALDVFSGYSDVNENLYAFIADGPAGVVAVYLSAPDNNNNGQNSSSGGGGGCFVQSVLN